MIPKTEIFFKSQKVCTLTIEGTQEAVETAVDIGKVTIVPEPAQAEIFAALSKWLPTVAFPHLGRLHHNPGKNYWGYADSIQVESVLNQLPKDWSFQVVDRPKAAKYTPLPEGIIS